VYTFIGKHVGGEYGGNILYTFFQVNGKMRPAETIPEMG
jgi:hypothetical protein